MSKFNYVEELDTCLWCGEKLKDVYSLQNYLNDMGEAALTRIKAEKIPEDYQPDRSNPYARPWYSRKELLEIADAKELNAEKSYEVLKGYKGHGNSFCSKICGFRFGMFISRRYHLKRISEHLITPVKVKS